jgi:hypothetical protein
MKRNKLTHILGHVTSVNLTNPESGNRWQMNIWRQFCTLQHPHLLSVLRSISASATSTIGHSRVVNTGIHYVPV